MKKHFLKSFALLAMLFSALTMSAATKYCGDQVQSTVDNKSVSIGVTILKVGDVLRVSFESEHISGIRGGGTFQQWGNGVWANQDDAPDADVSFGYFHCFGQHCRLAGTVGSLRI